MNLLALDLATNTGICWGDGSDLPILESHRLPSTGDDVGRFLAEHEDFMRSLIERVQPKLLVFEAPILPRPKFNRKTNKMEGGTSLIVTRKLQGLAGVTEMVAHRLSIPAAEAQPTEVKQALTGKGNAKKPDMVKACRSAGLDPATYVKDGMEQSDEADAFGVWLHGLHEFAPAHARGWQKRLHLARGGLI